MSKQEKILICPLDWGLGHASRCIPLIYAFLQQGHEVLYAGSGDAFALLQREFPQLTGIDLPSFTLRYSSTSSQVWAVAKALPRLLRMSIAEHRRIRKIVREYGITRVVSDNRFALYGCGCECVYLTHQVWVKLPQSVAWLEPLVAFLHRKIMQRYDACWIPDYAERELSLAGELSHPRKLPANAQYIGPLSRFVPVADKETTSLTMAVLSGVEPQRSLWEALLLEQLQQDEACRVVLVQGLPQKEVVPYKVGRVEVYASMPTEQLQQHLMQASHIICRSGYSSIMDMAALGKMAQTTFVPTPGQSEQEYLAVYLNAKNFGEHR